MVSEVLDWAPGNILDIYVVILLQTRTRMKDHVALHSSRFPLSSTLKAVFAEFFAPPRDESRRYQTAT